MPVPLAFEALPPRRESTDAQWQHHLELLDPLRRAGLWAVNVPEIHAAGDRQYQTVDSRAFASALQRHLGVRAILNRVTVHHSIPQLQAWATETRMGAGIRDLVLVGGDSSSTTYPGAQVVPALDALRTSVAAGGGTLGVVTIPTRRGGVVDEPDRLLRKAEAGAAFAISQIVCAAPAAQRLCADLAERSRVLEVRPPTVFWSLAPVGKRADLDFLRWLGVDVDEGYAGAIAQAPTGRRLETSHAANVATANAVLEAAEAAGVPVGLCVEHVMLSNIEAALTLVDRLRELTRSFGASGQRADAVPTSSVW